MKRNRVFGFPKELRASEHTDVDQPSSGDGTPHALNAGSFDWLWEHLRKDRINKRTGDLLD
jgi:hypothetical protein